MTQPITKQSRGYIAEVPELPDCNICALEFPSSQPQKARYDAKINNSQWAYLCQTHFEGSGAKLGVGLGQRLVLPYDNVKEISDDTIYCPDGGRCQHDCAFGGDCWRVTNCGPFSGFGEDWTNIRFTKPEEGYFDDHDHDHDHDN